MPTFATAIHIITETEDDFTETMTDVVVRLYTEAGEPGYAPLIEVVSVKDAKTGEDYDESRYCNSELDRRICNFVHGSEVYSY